MIKKISLLLFLIVNVKADPIFKHAYVSISDLEHNRYFDNQIKKIAHKVTYNKDGKYISQDNNENFLSKYDVIVLGTHDKLKACPNAKIKTKIIGTLSIATEHLNDIKQNHPEIYTVNSPTGNTISTAEHTFALMIALSKQLLERNLIDRRSSGLKGENLGTTELAGKTLGLVGFGNIARQVYKRAKAFDMKIISHTAHPEKYKSYSYVEFMPLEDVIKKCDILSLHVPENEQTSNLIDAQKLSTCKPGMLLINASRQGLVNHEDFKELLEIGKIGGLGLDYDHPDYDFKNFKNVWITPHIAGVTKESKLKMGNELVNNIIEVSKQLERNQNDSK